MTTKPSFIRDPDSLLDYRWNWSSWLQEGETIQSYELYIPSGLTKASDENDDTTVTAWFSGGEAGEKYLVTCRITTNQGRIDDRTIKLTTKER